MKKSKKEKEAKAKKYFFDRAEKDFQAYKKKQKKGLDKTS